MLRYALVSLAAGVLFGILDGVLNANSLAQRLYSIYRPIARESVNAPAGLLIDVFYGFAMAAVFVLLYPALPGGTGVVKGLSFGLGAWFFRVLMPALGQWIVFKVPAATVCYTLAGGLAEMLILGALYGAALPPRN